MSDNIIVDYVHQIELPIKLGQDFSPPTELPDSTTVIFSDGQTKSLSKQHPAAIAFAYALEFSRTQKRRLHIELAQDSETIDAILLPIRAEVLSLRKVNEENDVEVRLKFHPEIYFLRSGSEKFNEFNALLEAAKASGKELLITTATNRPEIIDLRRVNQNKRGRGWNVLSRIRSGWPFPRWRGVSKVTSGQAQDIFDWLAGKSCPPRLPSMRCIPFLYPDNGCKSRAHEMCRLMIRIKRLYPGKLWIYGSPGLGLEVMTANNPGCRCGWSYHCAPYLLSNDAGEPRRIVIDPSICDGPETEAVWKLKHQDAAANIYESANWIYYRDEGGVESYPDPFQLRTQTELRERRVLLCLRAYSPEGPPPYAC